MQSHCVRAIRVKIQNDACTRQYIWPTDVEHRVQNTYSLNSVESWTRMVTWHLIAWPTKVSQVTVHSSAAASFTVRLGMSDPQIVLQKYSGVQRAYCGQLEVSDKAPEVVESPQHTVTQESRVEARESRHAAPCRHHS